MGKKRSGYFTGFSARQMEDTDLYGIYINRSGFYNEKPTIIMFESRSVANILTDWYGKEV